MANRADFLAAFRMAIGRHSSRFTTVAWSPDGHWVTAAGVDGVIWLWRADSGECRLLEGHTGPIYGVAWSPDGSTLASGSDDGTVRVWDSANGRVRHTLEGHSDWVRSVAWSPDGQRLL
jgi:WD40 repeat protein